MKDSEFVELLNLYLDHEIDAEAAARLEAEVQSNAARRRVYQNYCRMHKACKILAQDFAVEGEAASDRKVVPFTPAASSNSRLGWYAGTFAAAACIAVVFVTRHRDIHTSPSASTAIMTQSSAPVVAPHEVSIPAHRGIERGNASDLSLRHTNQNLALATAAQNDPHFSWMQDVHLTPLQLATASEQLNLAVPTPKVETPSSSAGNKTLPSDVRWTAFRFQK